MQEFLQQIRERQSEVTHLNEATSRLTDGQVSPALEEIRRLRRSWMDLGQRAEELEAQRGEDMQRSGEYQEIVVAVEELFHQVSREWDYLARYQASHFVLDVFIYQQELVYSIYCKNTHSLFYNHPFFLHLNRDIFCVFISFASV